MKLIKPTIKYKKEFYGMMKEFELEWISMFWDKDSKVLDNIESYIENTRKYENWEKQTSSWGKAYTYWLIENWIIIWTINLRDTIKGKYLKRWWNIGYAIRKSQRWRWYATKMLELTLKEAKNIWLEKVLITCSTENIASSKTIEKNGWNLENIINLDWKDVSRYWITLS